MPKTRHQPPAEYLWGKRHGMREPLEIDVVCVGTGTTLHARTIDLSRGGMLVEVHDADVPPVGAGELVPLAFLVAVAFRGGMKAVLGPDVSVRAEIVRVTTSPVDRGFLRLGCRFRRRLSPRQCRQLGIDASDEADAALDLARAHKDAQEEPILPVELVEVTARPGKRRPTVRLAPLRERRRRDV